MKSNRKSVPYLPNKGSEALRAALADRQWTQLKVAKELGVCRATISRWLSGERVPDRAHMGALREMFNISPDAWV